MNCPHCSTALQPGVRYCGKCGFNIEVIRSMLGAEWVRLERLTDNLNALSLKEQRQLEVILDEFERTFPQCFFAVYLGALPSDITPQDLGFWLINHGAFHTQQLAKRNDFGIALIIDANRQMASISLGYALERLLPESDLDHLLQQVSTYLRHRRLGPAIEKTVIQVSKRLKKAGHKTKFSEIPESHWGQDIHGLGLQTLRSAHRSSKSLKHGES